MRCRHTHTRASCLIVTSCEVMRPRRSRYNRSIGSPLGGEVNVLLHESFWINVSNYSLKMVPSISSPED
jgi:hypothetical protein